MSDLLLCPFCGAEPEMNVFYEDDTVNVPNPICDIEFVVVRCSSCGISKEKLTVEAAANWWNGRHTGQQRSGS